MLRHTRQSQLYHSFAMSGEEAPLIAAIDQGTGSSRVLVFNESFDLVSKHQVEIHQYTPEQGWFEQEAEEYISSVRTCLEEIAKEIDSRQLRGIGITNQRETTVLWNKRTGKPLHRSVVWCDGRTAAVVNRMIKATPSKSQDDLRPRCGLPISTYFSALKIKWIMENSPEVVKAMEEGECLFGTVDTWLIWNLTGGAEGGVHVTDVTNASRTMLMNIHTQQWDSELCKFFGIPLNILPKIKSCSEVYGHIAEGALTGIPICGCIGDQQAALVGQQCFNPGDAKNTYGTGCFLLYNTGLQPVMSQHGMLTTVGYQLGPHKPVTFALEGAVSVAGQCVRWLRDNLKFFDEASQIEGLANEVEDTGGVYFVPAFSGLFAPYWQSDARGLIIGLTNYTTKAHLCRATLEAVCFQSREILEAMNQDSELPLNSVRVDGGMTANNLLLKLQADILGIKIVRPDFSEMTALGAAIAAGLAAGVWKDTTQLPKAKTTVSEPTVTADERDAKYSRWKEAVSRCMHWEGGEDIRHREKRRNGKITLAFSLGLITGGVVCGALLLALMRKR